MMKKKILLYYKYVSLENPEEIKQWQLSLCQELGLKGRIILAKEGINGTVCGSSAATNAYIQAMNHHTLFQNIDFKENEVNGSYNYFQRMRVVVKNEIVHLGLDPEKITAHDGGTHLKPEELHHLLEQRGHEVTIFDGRNAFESRIGTFKNAITPDINHFRDLPDYIDQNLEQFQDKEVIMFCTGGIRCERASAYLKSKQVAKKVFQLEGGIHRYIEKYPDGFFRGKNYVFDNRVAVKVNDDILGTCDICSTSCDEYTNCLNATCNKHFIGCPSCIQTFSNTCGQACFTLVKNKEVHLRPFPTYVKE